MQARHPAEAADHSTDSTDSRDSTSDSGAIGPPLGHPLRTSAWFDLVFHLLSSLPVSQDDASSLFDLGYLSWVEQHWPSPAQQSRVLLQDQALLAELYARERGSYYLATLALLFDDIDHLSSTMTVAFEELGCGAGMLRAGPAQELLLRDHWTSLAPAE